MCAIFTSQISELNNFKRQLLVLHRLPSRLNCKKCILSRLIHKLFSFIENKFFPHKIYSDYSIPQSSQLPHLNIFPDPLPLSPLIRKEWAFKR